MKPPPKPWHRTIRQRKKDKNLNIIKRVLRRKKDSGTETETGKVNEA